MTPEELEELEEKEAEEYLHSLSKITPASPTEKPIINNGLLKDDMDDIMSNNFDLIEGCNKLLRDRIMNDDASLTLKDLISAKDTAFKQNQLIMGRATENVNVNINELQEKSPAELLEMLNSLN